ncbi:aspartate kinase [Intestinicryptomonas porci]|uniref:Aspartokinase n=1 Tax=Intestinicryptomonas porci TaxID=2926320 RepID=A0ABU4WK54_9BACT|nr:aspartate kinase [Opitutales bacterium CLA-KB-P66]
MALIVQKYGGTSVGDVERIKVVAQRIKENVDAGNDVVVVVSARSGVTNQLIERAKALNSMPNEREMDMLLAVGEQETIALVAMALHSLGVKAVSRTGAQAGIITDFNHTRARIIEVTGGDIKKQLASGNVVIVAGFQGIDPDGHVSTLGRGGSDLSAMALAGALKADICQIFTDVDGIYTADPRIVKSARKIEVMDYDELLEMASSGSKVMQARSVEFARKYNVVFEVRSSFNNNSGTIVKAEVPTLEGLVVSGVAVDKNQTKVTITGIPDKPGSVAEIFEDLGASGIGVDMIVQNIGRAGMANLTFTVAKDDASKAEKILQNTCSKMGAEVSLTGDIAKVSVVGIGMRSNSGVAATFFSALAQKNINVQLITTSEIKICVAINLDKADEAACALHTAFGLDK